MSVYTILPNGQELLRYFDCKIFWTDAHTPTHTNTQTERQTYLQNNRQDRVIALPPITIVMEMINHLVLHTPEDRHSLAYLVFVCSLLLLLFSI